MFQKTRADKNKRCVANTVILTRATMAQLRNVCFTIHVSPCITHETVLERLHDDTFKATQRLRYCIFQRELTQNGREHLQGYAEFNELVTMAMLRQIFNSTVHIERRQGTREQARDYCRKADSRVPDTEPFEVGIWETQQGKRNDLDAAIECMLAEGFDAMVDKFPAVFVKNGRGLKELWARKKPRMAADELVLKPWQQHVVDTLALPANDRTIYWVTDTQGGKGKSRLSRYLISNCNAVLLSGKLADMAYILANALDSEHKPTTAVFDISRAAAEHVTHLYSMAEMVKNGLVVSNKYESRQLVFDPLHVVFFSNQSWDRTKFSHDRVKEMNLSAGDVTF